MSTAVSRILDHLRDDGSLQGKDIANIVGVSPATVSRWSSGKATPNLRTQTVIAELRYVVDRLNDFYTPDETRIWVAHGSPDAQGRARHRSHQRRTYGRGAGGDREPRHGSFHVGATRAAARPRSAPAGSCRCLSSAVVFGPSMARRTRRARSSARRRSCQPMVQWAVRCPVHKSGTRGGNRGGVCTTHPAAGLSVQDHFPCPLLARLSPAVPAPNRPAHTREAGRRYGPLSGAGLHEDTGHC
jgi:transcriptional regulator with XRE-family HTH domain